MKRVLIAAVLTALSWPAAAQQARVVTTCGSLAPFGPLPAGGTVLLAVDTNNVLCSNATGGGGGGSVTQGTVPWVMDTTGSGNLDNEVKAPIATGANVIGYTSGDFCTQGVNKLSAPFAITSATQTSLVAAVSAKKIYICSLSMITGLANNVNIYDVGAAGACSSAATDAVIGPLSNAATNGFNFAANGGLTLGNGGAMVANTTTANSTLCVVTSSAGPLSGNLTYVQQ